MNASSRNRGSVLIITMVILFAIAALVLTLNRQARTQSLAAANDLSSQQADSIERGAEQYAMSLLSTDYRSTLNDLTDTDYAAVPVGTGFFWIIRPTYGDANLPVFGLMDESSKINLNKVAADSLSVLPGMTDDIAGAIIDWRDADDDMTDNGAETATYNGLTEPYNAKNANFESVDEMLLLNGMTKELMYGDPTQASAGDSDPDSYYLAHGLSDYFTCWSTLSATAPDGTPRINMSDTTQTTRQSLKELLENTLGQAAGDNAYNLAFPRAQGPNSKGLQPATDLFDLASRASLSDDQFQEIENYIYSVPDTQTVDPNAPATTTGPVGLININTAPREVLLTLTASDNVQLAVSDIDALLAARSAAVASNPTSMSWVYDALHAKAAGLGNFITGQGSQYSADIVAVNGNGRGYRHVKIVIDTSGTVPQIIYRHDITDHGWPLDPKVLTQLQSGQGVTADESVVLNGGGTH